MQGNRPSATLQKMEAMQGTLNTLQDTLQDLGQQSSRLSSSAPTMKDAGEQIKKLRHEIREQKSEQNEEIEKCRHDAQDVMLGQVVHHMQPGIKAAIADEVAKQTRQEVNSQITGYIPVPLRQQAAKSREELEKLQTAFHNLHARRQNSTFVSLSDEIYSQPLAVVVTQNGKPSSHFPKDLETLFRYDLDIAQKLLKDYGLETSPSREENFNRFLTHIGVPLGFGA